MPAPPRPEEPDGVATALLQRIAIAAELSAARLWWIALPVWIAAGALGVAAVAWVLWVVWAANDPAAPAPGSGFLHR